MVTSADVGMPLFKDAPMPKLPAGQMSGTEPYVIPNCTVQYEERQQVGAEVDGKIEIIATPWTDGTPDANDPNVVYHPRDPKKEHPYRRLKDGDLVKNGQILCLLDDQIVQQKMVAADAMQKAAQEVMKSAEEGLKLSKQKYELTLTVINRGGGAQADLISDLLTVSRFQENLAQAKQSIAKSESDYSEARVMLSKHQVRSHVNGFVRSISRQPGEFVKQGEKIMELQATDVVRVEGNLDVQYASAVKRGMTIQVEPAIPSAPEKSRDWHRQEVTSIAVTAHPKRPLVVSAGADGAAVVWDVTREQRWHNLPHPVPVRSVACTPPTAPFFRAVTGADDGKIRVWDLTNPDQLPSEPREGSEAHPTAVQAIAFSPDGRHFATASGADIWLWETEGGRKLYPFPREHRDIVTSLTITPQCTLVSASRDRSLKVWKLGQDKAAVVRSIDHRSGTIDTLAVSNDGGRVLFDQDKNRLDVVGLADMQTLSQIHNPGSGGGFANFALFNPDDRLLVTAGGEGEMKGGVQVWSTPAPGGRGSELARLIAPGRAGITCAAFSPVKEVPFLVVGTSNGGIHLWKPPAGEPKKVNGVITKIDATDPRYVTIRGEFANRELGLLDRSAGTMIITPAGK